MSQTRAVRAGAVLAVLAAVPLAYAASFSITGSDTSAKTLAPASGGTETGTVASTGNLAISGSTVAVTVNGGSGTRTAVIDNSGVIRQTGTGRAVRANSSAVVLNITNRAGASLSAVGDDAIQISANAAGSSFTLNNSGTVMSTNSRAVNLRDIGGSNSITNNAGGVLRSTGNDAIRPGVNGIINNSGLIEAVPVLESVAGGVTQASSNDGIQADPDGTAVVTGVQVTNNNGAAISGRHGITGGATTSANFAITVTNNVGGTITGVNGSGINIDNNGAFLGNATVINNGTITGNFDSTKYNTGDGDGVDVDGLLTLTNNGIIRGTGASGNGSDGGGNNPEGVSIGGGMIVNNAGAEITGRETTGSGRKGHGVLVDNSSGGNAFSATTVTNGGLIRGYDSYAIRFIGSYADTISNNATGVIQGAGNAAEGAAIQTGDGNDTLTNRGTIQGDNGLAIDLEAGNDTLHLIGGSIIGDVSGGSGSNTLDIDGSFTYAGILSNFTSVEIKSGIVSLSGASTYAGNTTVSGGSLYANNVSGSATGTGAVTVKSGAVLGGSGTVGNVVAETGSTIAPGKAITPGNLGSLSISGNLAITGGSRFSFELGSSADRLNISGTLNFSGGGAAVIDIVDAGLVAGTDYTLINYGSANGFLAANAALGGLPPGLEATLEVTPTALILRTAAKIDASPTSLSFAERLVNTSSDEQTVTVTNTGTVTLNVGTPTITGSNAADFLLGSNTCSSGLAPNASCLIGVSFKPAAAGGRSAALQIPSNSADLVSVNLSGTGVAAIYSLSVSPASIDFGNQPVGSPSAAQSLSFSNDGNVAITITGFNAGGNQPTEFAIGNDNCSGRLLAVQESCTTSFSFTPARSGSRSASLSVNSSPAQSGAAARFTLQGIGTEASASLNPASLNFAAQAVGSYSLAQSVSLANTGNAALTISGIAATGDFMQTSHCGLVLAAGSSCTIDVSFAPTATGSRSGTLSVSSSAASSPTLASLSGTGGTASNKPMRLALAAASINVKEGAGSAVFEVNRSGSFDGAVSVRYATADGSAIAGQDYTAASGTLSWAPGDSAAKTITVPLIDDQNVEDKESFTLSLSAPTGNAILGRASSTANIVDDDKAGALAFSASAVSVDENAGTLTVTVQRSGGQAGAVGIHYVTVNGSALAGADYAATAGDLSWSAGDAADKTFTIPIVWDSLAERSENFRIELSAPTGGVKLNNPKVQRVTIVNVPR
ncbi:choice-of-anchor D domain-containing protein [Nevskia ramosa]|uniref:choice-of-anchor D domain-containing protein n=1 Tax=Nevskia ramosa TaxID=64002 RepID=UPI0003B696A6|nr:choice-of-anchor D domain-containing protein [Nevskia ramosa]